ncbi:MAG: sugar ABC transporter substrate-binding protein [Candidatus Sumerlaeota bacterium]|nr:sugar ABC transporter substrate-binding protein [Candidatus Sumerlaeota bacterium]
MGEPRPMRMRNCLSAALTALTLFAFTGCGNGGSGRVKLTWSMWALPTHIPAFKKAKKDFEKLHPNIRVNLIVIPWIQYNNKLITMTAAGAGPDVLWVDKTWAVELMFKNALLDLAPLVAADPAFRMADFAPGINDFFRQGDRLYGLMSHYSVMLLLYNKDLFDKAGVPYPTGQWTWDDARRAADRITTDTNGDSVPDRFGCVLPPAEYATASAFAWQAGGTIWGPSWKGRGANTTQSQEALSFLLGLIDSKGQPTPSQTQTADIGELFKTGRLGYMLTWPSGVREMTRGVPFKWEVTILPKGRQRATFGGGPAYAISRTTKHPKEAWEFTKFLLSREVQLDMAKAGLVMPSLVMSREDLLSVFPNEAVVDCYMKSLPYARSVPKLKDLNLILNRYTEEMEKASLKLDTLDKATARFSQFLDGKIRDTIKAFPELENEALLGGLPSETATKP